MRRREFTGLLGGAAAWPLAARSQQSATPLIGVLSTVSAPATDKRMVPFHRGLNDSGVVLGRDFLIEISAAEGQYDKLPALAAALLNRNPALVAALGPGAALAMNAASSSIPIVFVAALDPVRAGLVRSLNRPGSNMTGVTFIGASLGPKRLELVRELIPGAGNIALLSHPTSPDALEELHDLQDAAKVIGQQLLVLAASSDRELEPAFAEIANRGASALLVLADPFFLQSAGRLVELSDRYRLPTIFWTSEIVAVGGLMSYGADISDAFRIAGTYAGRILKGTKPADLPVQQPTRFELVINLKTAKALGIEVPPMLLARADEVIE